MAQAAEKKRAVTIEATRREAIVASLQIVGADVDREETRRSTFRIAQGSLDRDHRGTSAESADFQDNVAAVMRHFINL